MMMMMRHDDDGDDDDDGDADNDGFDDTLHHLIYVISIEMCVVWKSNWGVIINNRLNTIILILFLLINIILDKYWKYKLWITGNKNNDCRININKEIILILL